MLEGPFLPPEAIDDLEKYVNRQLGASEDKTFLKLVGKLIATAKRDGAKASVDITVYRQRVDAIEAEAAVTKAELDRVKLKAHEARMAHDNMNAFCWKLREEFDKARSDLDALVQDVMTKATEKPKRKKAKKTPAKRRK